MVANSLESFYLLDHLKENSDTSFDTIKLLKYELDQRIYYYGDQFKLPRESTKNCLLLKDLIKGLYSLLVLCKGINDGKNKRVISNAYFTVNSELKNLNIDVFLPIHQPVKTKALAGDLKLLKIFTKVNNVIKYGSFHSLLQNEFISQIESFKTELFNWYVKSNIASLIVPNDIAFFEYLNISIFKEMQKPSFIFLHGLPARYNIYDDNQTDYLIVWGDKIKENYISNGFSADKILISGHPYYKKNNHSKLRNSFENILIISKAMCGAQHRDKVIISDRGNSILYLISLQKVLKSKGVKQVRLRLHPSENFRWYFNFIDPEFFKLDSNSLSVSLSQASLVIGPASTVLLESIYYGVNYLVYEPCINNLDLMGFYLVPPFDGSDLKIHVAKNEKELAGLLKSKSCVEPSVLSDYIQTPFDISFIKKLI